MQGILATLSKGKKTKRGIEETFFFFLKCLKRVKLLIVSHQRKVIEERALTHQRTLMQSPDQTKGEFVICDHLKGIFLELWSEVLNEGGGGMSRGGSG